MCTRWAIGIMVGVAHRRFKSVQGLDDGFSMGIVTDQTDCGWKSLPPSGGGVSGCWRCWGSIRNTKSECLAFKGWHFVRGFYEGQWVPYIVS